MRKTEMTSCALPPKPKRWCKNRCGRGVSTGGKMKRKKEEKE
jgi:hypothetical protein